MSRSRTEVAYDEIRRRIVEWELSPGTPLSEQELASELELSRTPVREALQRLSREELVRMVRGKGAFVAEISIPDVIELFEMREALEAQASRLASRSSDSDALVAVRTLLAERGRAALAEGDVSAYYSMTAGLDQEVVRLADNQRLARALDETWTQIHRVRRLSSASLERLQASVKEHIDILTAIIQGDEEDADQLTRAHVRNSLQHILGRSRDATRRVG